MSKLTAILFLSSSLSFSGIGVAVAQEVSGMDGPVHYVETSRKQTTKLSMPVERNALGTLSAIQPNGTAPNISSERVTYVDSTNTDAAGGEQIAPGQTTTKLDEGGAQLAVYVLEMGYGSATPYMTMAGNQLPHSALVERDQVCVENGSYKSPCDPGYTVVGYYYIVNLSGYQSGKFTFLNSSVNNASVTGSTYINIL